MVRSDVAYAACLFTLKASGRLAQVVCAYGCFATLAPPASMCVVFMFHIFFDISVVICASCPGPCTCTRRLERCLWSVLFMYNTMLLSCFWVSGCGLGESVLGSFAQDHGMVCLCGVVWVSVGQSTSSRYACTVARVRAGRVLMVGMVACH
jgi:hypothetical protein